MAVNSVIPPYPSFFDADGVPLENGQIYVGQPGFEARSTPKASYFDFALTIPTGTDTGAAVLTLAGFPVRNGAAAMVYVDGDFSITVLDRNGVLVYSALSRTFAFGLADASGLPVQIPDGNFAVAGLGFINEPNTGRVRQGAGVVQEIVGGNVIYQWNATGVEFLFPPSGAGFVSGVAAALDQDLKDIAAIVAVEGDMIYRNGTAWAKLAVGPAGKVLRRNDLLTPNIGPIWDDAIIARAAQSTATGTDFDFLTIPSWVRKITVLLNGVSLSGTNNFLVQLGTSAGIVAAGYAGGGFVSTGGGGSYVANSTGFVVATNAAAESHYGQMVLSRFGTGNAWVSSHSTGSSARASTGGGAISLPGVLDRVRLTRDGADTFDAGSVSISYE